MCWGIRWTSLWVFSPPKKQWHVYYGNIYQKTNTYTCKWKTSAQKKTTFYRTTLNSIKAQSHSSHHFRESYHFLGFSVQLSTPCCQHSTYRSLGLSLCSSSPFPSPHLLCYSPGKAERARCPHRRQRTAVVLTFPPLRDCTSSFPAQVTWRAFKNRCSEIWGEQKPKEFRFPLLDPPDAVDTKVSIW